ncbi:MAG: DUF4157 domain-containing protein [Methanosarcina barkeri]|nr:DUF4157 domain-containing protein [Methanosarcina sp. ERenArc_MAG2]
MPEHQQIQQSKKPNTIFENQATPLVQTPLSNPYSIIQRAKINPKSLTHADIMQLQRTIGNQAVGRLLTGIGNTSTAQQAPVQRPEIPEEEETCPSCIQKQEIPEEEEPLQGKIIETIQRQEIPEEEPLQTKRENNTGMPDNLKAGVESLSGIDMSDVRVHYNSDIPSQLQAHAYAQGTDIHLAPGKEKHLSHEAWHVVQQKQGRVKPTLQTKGKVNINDDAGLEKEADVMGQKAIQFHATETQSLKESPLSSSSSPQQQVAQLRHIGLFGLEAEVVGERFKINAMNYSEEDLKIMGEQDTTYPIINDPAVVLEEYSLGKLSDSIKITLDNEVTDKSVPSMVERSYTVEFIQNPVDVLGDQSNIDAVASDWNKVTAFWKYLYAQKDSGSSFHELMQAREEITLNQRLEGEQFITYEGNENIATEETEEGKNIA